MLSGSGPHWSRSWPGPGISRCQQLSHILDFRRIRPGRRRAAKPPRLPNTTMAEPPKRRRTFLAALKRLIERVRLDNPSNRQRSDLHEPEASEVASLGKIYVPLVAGKDILLFGCE